jgi:uncharacterized cupredoxin-like copper-binding protein/mono/diheme cytochrome c family protein/heme/copper-type cytochrome/quinol oxidase subunit 4
MANQTKRLNSQPSPYVVVFFILALFTVMEAGVTYLPSLPEGIRVGVLVFLAATKVSLVLLYFMHLKSDYRVFALPFALGLVLVAPLVLIVGLTTGESSAPQAGQPPAATTESGSQASQVQLVSEGKQLFAANCSMCHDGPNGVGPMFAGMAQRAATREQGKTAQQYIHQSIVDPSAYVVEGFQDNLMPKDFGQKFSDQQLNALVAYIMADSGGAAGTPVPAGSPTAAPTSVATGAPVPAGSPTAAPTPAGTGTPSAQQTAGQTTVTVTENTFSLKPSPDSVQAGSITFHVTNQATDIPHQLTVIRTDVAAAQLPVDSQDDPLLNQLDVVGQTDNIAPGQTADLTLNLPAGHYALICALHGHYHAGMYADFTVQ